MKYRIFYYVRRCIFLVSFLFVIFESFRMGSEEYSGDYVVDIILSTLSVILMLSMANFYLIVGYILSLYLIIFHKYHKLTFDIEQLLVKSYFYCNRSWLEWSSYYSYKYYEYMKGLEGNE